MRTTPGTRTILKSCSDHFWLEGLVISSKPSCLFSSSSSISFTSKVLMKFAQGTLEVWLFKMQFSLYLSIPFHFNLGKMYPRKMLLNNSPFWSRHLMGIQIKMSFCIQLLPFLWEPHFKARILASHSSLNSKLPILILPLQAGSTLEFIYEYHEI